MKLIKIIIDHTHKKVFGQSITNDGEFTLHQYNGFNDCTEAQKVVDNKSITIYDLRPSQAQTT